MLLEQLDPVPEDAALEGSEEKVLQASPAKLAPPPSSGRQTRKPTKRAAKAPKGSDATVAIPKGMLSTPRRSRRGAKSVDETVVILSHLFSTAESGTPGDVPAAAEPASAAAVGQPLAVIPEATPPPMDLPEGAAAVVASIEMTAEIIAPAVPVVDPELEEFEAFELAVETGPAASAVTAVEDFVPMELNEASTEVDSVAVMEIEDPAPTEAAAASAAAISIVLPSSSVVNTAAAPEAAAVVPATEVKAAPEAEDAVAVLRRENTTLLAELTTLKADAESSSRAMGQERAMRDAQLERLSRQATQADADAVKAKVHPPSSHLNNSATDSVTYFFILVESITDWCTLGAVLDPMLLLSLLILSMLMSSFIHMWEGRS